MVINVSSKCLGKFKIKKCNTQFCENKETHHSRERELQADKEEYDEMRQALLMLADLAYMFLDNNFFSYLL